MSIIVEPPIQGLLAEFLIAISIITLGIILEHKKQNRASIFANIIGLGLLLVSSPIDLVVLPLLIGYLALGVLIALIEIKRVYGFFGSKVYGSLLFAVALFHIPSFQENIRALINSENSDVVIVLIYSVLILMWLIVATASFVISKIVLKK